MNGGLTAESEVKDVERNKQSKNEKIHLPI